jgi:hypothetical protein
MDYGSNQTAVISDAPDVLKGEAVIVRRNRDAVRQLVNTFQ